MTTIGTTPDRIEYALTVLEPWAGLIALKEKRNETRSWLRQSVIGERSAIHAGTSEPPHRKQFSMKLEAPLLAVGRFTEADADIVMFLTRNDEKKEAMGEMEQDVFQEYQLIVAKNRQGSQCTINLVFRPEYTQFTGKFDETTGF